MTQMLRMTPEQYNARELKRKGNKFGAIKKMVDGIEFDSTREAERYMALRLEEKAGAIRALKMHVPLQPEVNGQHVFTYEADFTYERRVGEIWVMRYEDSKGYRKGAAYQLFRLKKAIIKAALGIEIDEV